MKMKTFFKTTASSLGLLVFFLLPALGENSTPPPQPDMEMFLENGILFLTESNTYIQQLTKTDSWKDMPLSEQYIDLLTLGNQVESQLKIPMAADFIRELFGAPMEITLWDAFNKDKPTSFLIAIDIKPGFQTLLKLGESYAQSMKHSTSIKLQNTEILETKWNNTKFYHVVRNNQLLMSNNLEIFTYFLNSTTPQSRIKGFRDQEFFNKYCKKAKGNIKCRINLLSWLSHFEQLLQKQELLLGLNITANDTITYETFVITTEPAFEPGPASTLATCSEWIPHTAVFAYSSVFPASHYLLLLEQLPITPEQKNQSPFNIENDVTPLFNHRFFFYTSGLGTNSSEPVIKGVIGFSLNKLNPAKKEKLAAFLRWIMAPEDIKMTSQTMKSPDGVLNIYHFPGNNAPAFCISDNWLLVSSSKDQLDASINTFQKKSPSMMDTLLAQGLAQPQKQKGYSHIYLQPQGLFHNLGEHFTFSAESATNFNALDIKNKILPILHLLENMSPLVIITSPTNQYRTLDGKITYGHHPGGKGKLQ